MSTSSLSPQARYAVLVTAFLALVFNGVELGLMQSPRSRYRRACSAELSPPRSAVTGSHASRRR